MAACDKAPRGWKCTRAAGHKGSCAAIRNPWWKRLGAAIGNAIGQAKFGQ